MGVAALHAGHPGAADAAAPAEVVRGAGAVGRRVAARSSSSRLVAGGIAFGFEDDHDPGRGHARAGRRAAAAGRDGRLPRRPPARRRHAGVLALDDHRRAAGRRRRRGVHDVRLRDPRPGRAARVAIRDWFPTAGEFAWTDLLQTPVDSADLFRGVIQSLALRRRVHRAGRSGTSPAGTSPEPEASRAARPAPSPRPSRRR